MEKDKKMEKKTCLTPFQELQLTVLALEAVLVEKRYVTTKEVEEYRQNALELVTGVKK